MLVLDNSGALVRIITSAVCDVDVQVSFVDHTVTGDVFLSGAQNTLVTTATTTTICGTPTADKRNVKLITIRNAHATTAVTITVEHTDGTTSVEIDKFTLLAQEKWVLNDAGVPFLFDAAGGVKGSTLALADPRIITKELLADQSNSTTTPTEVVGLTVPLDVGTWQFIYTVIYSAAVTTTGVRFSVNHTGTAARFVANVRWVDVLATASSATPDQDGVIAAGHAVGAFSARAKSTAGWGTTLGVDTNGGDMLMIIEGTMVVTVAGNIALWHGSEVAAASTVEAGSSLVATKTSA